MSKYLGDVSAYAYAVSKGYTGTEEEFAELMADYADVGQTAVEAAQTATTKASEASASAATASTAATTATTKASEATTAAGTASTAASTATTKASEANTSAGTAAQNATTAVTKASEAATSATAAASSATAAQTAQTAAETAQGKAEDAAEQAEEYADRLTDFLPTDTASGSIASFPDGADGVEVKTAVVQIVPKQSGTGDPSPDNVRPITGWDAVTVTGTGANIIQLPYYDGTSKTDNGVTFTVNSDGSVTANGTATANAEFVLFYKSNTYYPAFEYILSGLPATGSPSTFGFNTYARGENNESLWDVRSYNTRTFTATIPIVNRLYIGIRIFSGYTANNLTFYPQFEPGATATDYEPYQGETCPLTLPSTVYGGTLTYDGNGVWTVTSDKGAVDLGSLTWTRRGTYAMQSNGLAALIAQPAANVDPNLVCSIAKSSNWTELVSAGPSAGLVGTSGGYIAISTDATDPDAWKASVTGQTLVYPLATPVTYTLTTEQVVTLLGQNNIWADSGDTSVTYRADIQLYIDKLTGSTEDDMTADSNIPNNTYFLVGNTLYKSTAAIEQGATIAPGTNCTKTDLAAALNALQ